MRRLSWLVLAWTLCVPLAAQAQVTRAQQATPETGDLFNAAEDISLPAPMTVGNTIVVVAGYGGTTRTLGSISDGGTTNTYTEIIHVDSVAADFFIACAPVVTANQTITITLSGSSNGTDILMVYELAGAASDVCTTSPPNGTATVAAASSTPTSDLTTTIAQAILIGGMQCSNGTYDIDADFTADHDNNIGVIGDDEISSAATYNMSNTWTGSETCSIGVVAFEADASAAATTKALLLLGVGGVQ